MANLAVVKMTLAGTAPALVAAGAGGDTFDNDGNTLFEVRNAGGGAVTVTINATTPCNHGFDHDVAVSVPATTGVRVIGPFPVNRFGRSVSVTYSGVTSVTVMPYQPSV